MNTQTLTESSTYEQLLNTHTEAHTLGQLGEQLAQEQLMRHSWIILDRNWHSRYGELDIVALDPHEVLVFVEVKARRSTRFGTPQEAVSTTKQRKVRKTALQWIAAHSNVHHYSTRFDVIAISITDNTVNYVHVKEAF